MRSFVLLALALFWALPAVAKKSQDEIQILGLVAGRAISNRQVEIDLILENPFLFQKSGAEFVDKARLESGLNRVMTQYMVIEELKVIGEANVPAKELESALTDFKKHMGPKAWKSFLEDYEMTEPLVRDRLAEKLQVQRAIDDRVKLALSAQAATPGENRTPPQREALMRKSIEDWVSQLRTRYRVQIFRYKK